MEQERVRHAGSLAGRIAALEAEDTTGQRLRDLIKISTDPPNIIRELKHKRSTVVNGFYGILVGGEDLGLRQLIF